MSEKLELRHLRYFLALSGERHFGRAAEGLGVTQPLLSRQIRNLEEIVGVPLLAQTRPTVELTAAGVLLSEQAQQTLLQTERAIRAARNASGSPQRLVIALEPCSTLHGLSAIVRKFHASLPNVQIDIHELPVVTHVQQLRSGEVDIAFSHRNEAADGIAFNTMATESLMLVLPSGHRLSRHRRVDLAELGAEPFVLWSRSLAPACYDCILQAVRSRGLDGEIRHKASNHQTLLEMVAGGLGWTIAPACARGMRQAGVVFRSLAGIDTAIDIGFAHLASSSDRRVRLLAKLWQEAHSKVH
jgi:DNA-binding transcriptional LysR family regulator